MPAAATVATKDIQSTGGTSIKLTGQKPTSGYMVALKQYQSIIHGVPDKYTTLRKLVNNYVQQHAVPLNEKANYLGGWFDKGDGNLYLDVSQNVADRKAAFSLGHEHNQISIWNVDKGEEHYMMSDQKRPSESKGKPIREAVKKAEQKRLYFKADKTTVEQITRELWDAVHGK